MEGTVIPAALVLKADKPAYRQGLLNYIDAIDKEEIPEYQELLQELEDLESELEDLIEVDKQDTQGIASCVLARKLLSQRKTEK
jgi:hypothetical protein